MKSILLVCVAACLFSTAFAQNDTTKKRTDTTIKKETNDTIRIGGMIIIKKPGSEDREIITNDHYSVRISQEKKAREFNNQLVDHRYGFFRF